jgi:hypothetical protein
MENQTDIYEKLARNLDRLPGGFPATTSRVELQILRKIFSSEEAQLAGHLTGTSQTADVIAAQAGVPLRDVSKRLDVMRERGLKRLDVMRERGLIWSSEKEGVQRFRLAPYIVGIYEAQRDVMDHELSHLFEHYWNEGGGEAIMRYEPALHRVVPAHRAIKNEVILPYDDVKMLIMQSQSFEMHDCICRKQQDILSARKCHFPLRNCLVFSARDGHAGPNAATQDDILRALDEAEEIGLVHTVSNVATGILAGAAAVFYVE